ncbi:hypothetical protein [Streptomyces sp. NPDC088785]|uniref:hypothetical protein n=1 Tax=Streptomyces sp. NPDC088785 TaxID=3365897 RepID=UPI0038092C16
MRPGQGARAGRARLGRPGAGDGGPGADGHGIPHVPARCVPRLATFLGSPGVGAPGGETTLNTTAVRPGAPPGPFTFPHDAIDVPAWTARLDQHPRSSFQL